MESFPSIKSLDQVTAIKENYSSPGSFLAIQGYALVEINAQQTLTVLAGSISEAGMLDGNLTIARFGTMLSFIQLDNPNHLLLADRGNKRIRRVDLASSLVDTHSGNCTHNDVDGSSSGVCYKELYDMAVQPGTGIIAITDGDRLHIIHNGRDNRKVETKFKARGYMSLRRVAFIDNRLYVTSLFNGVCVFNSTFDFESCFEPTHDYDWFSDLYMNAAFIAMKWPVIDASDIYGIAKLSESTILVTMALNEGTGLFTVNINTQKAKALCFDSTESSNGQTNSQMARKELFVDCAYIKGSSFLHLVNSTLLISGDTEEEGTLVVELTLDGR